MKKQIIKTKPRKIVEINISTDGCAGKPYFSITGRRLDIQESGRFTESVSGCIHDEILKVAPELKLFVDLHLSTLDGAPMHAVENGFYWLCKAAGIPQKYAPEQDKKICFEYLCNHLRIDSMEASKIIGKVVFAYLDGKAKIATSHLVSDRCKEEQEKQGLFDAKNAFKNIVDSMKERWQNEAAAALKQLEKIK